MGAVVVAVQLDPETQRGNHVHLVSNSTFNLIYLDLKKFLK